ncbi:MULTISPECIES: FkbM family methyltransferase [Pectobacterium]|uniref:protein O-GlcNAc transferase n=3 Tax=Pectobacterium versatile TaxID=2488639 RepID=A0A855ME10_9GAMM|nr:FkbM family methyltransferase [Pectobacterium brasiliense]POY49107.1 methyltransferase type 11 [Pectobacterium versatile]WJM82591.1 FkbM family methyltransferase [Pectobacterium brasiliense]
MKKSSEKAVINKKKNADSATNQKIKLAAEWLSTQPGNALQLVTELLQRDEKNPLLLVIAGRAQQKLGNFFEAEQLINEALKRYPSYLEAIYAKADLLYRRERLEEAEIYLFDAIRMVAKYESRPLRSLQATVLQKLKKYEQAEEIFNELIQEDPSNWMYWSNLGMIKQDLGYFDEMDAVYQKGEITTKSNPAPFFNRIVGSHYHPERTAEQILALCKAWQPKFKFDKKSRRAVAKNKTLNKMLRIGMISDGFRSHPVGNMVTIGLSHIPESQIEFYAYSTNYSEDHITQKIKEICTQWKVIADISNDSLAKIIREDEVDILFDLCGYNANSRMLTLLQGPAPIQIKWVGGLISSTGLETMDYLLSDPVETPAGVDALYTEKLIRLPDDYICYDPPHYLPPLSELPVASKGYVTFGCFNNASKINDILLSQWAIILNSVPNSQLFLKSFNYTNQALSERIYATLEKHGISRERVRIEGGSPHRELLASYNDVDIALDPWPYSGGLTTCEAMAMGVPVVTLPGPTFAGRHSASHLVNAGMPELVANDWEQYINITVGIANDVDSLSVIRQHLRDILLSSPVCDGKRFAKNFADAMRAIWQRYCEGKAPEALTLSNDFLPYFHDDNQPVILQHPASDSVVSTKQQDGFSFQLSGKIIVMDHGGSLATNKNFINLTATNAFHFIIMDMLGEVEERHLPLRKKGIQHIKLHGLGDGESSPVYMCLAPEYSSDLVPLSAEGGSRVLTEVMAQTSKLDHIHGLDHLDWLILDNRYDIRKAIIHGKRILSDCLVVQVKITFSQTHQEQLLFSDINSLLTQYGFYFHSLEDIEYAKPTVIDDQKMLPSSKMISAVAVYLPDNVRVHALTVEQREKLAFILHTVYRMYNNVYSVLKIDSQEKSENYLIELNIKNENNLEDIFSVESDFFKKQSISSDFVMGLDDFQTSSTYHSPISSIIRVVDIGANPIDGEPPYKDLLLSGKVDLIGFEPQRDALNELNTKKGIHERYLPYAVGTGEEVTLYLCRASGMTSTLRPNFTILNHFQGYPVWAEILHEERLRTVRLDDIDEIKGIDWLKIDIQGGELNVFLNAEEKLKDTLVIQTEVNFIQLYENQPLFAEIDQWMRAHGFMLHTLLEERRRLYAPYVLNNQIHQGFNQLTTADAVYVRDINRLNDLTAEQLNKMATILRESYGSLDLAEKIMAMNNTRVGK